MNGFGISVGCAKLESMKMWRHNNCPFFIENSINKCLSCQRLNASFRTQKTREVYGKKKTFTTKSFKEKAFN